MQNPFDEQILTFFFLNIKSAVHFYPLSPTYTLTVKVKHYLLATGKYQNVKEKLTALLNDLVSFSKSH